jgi:hypothetical protein
MNIAQKRKVGGKLGRAGISLRIAEIARDISNGSLKNAIERAGQISVLVEAASFDTYWDEKAGKGKYREQEIFSEIIEGNIPVDRAKAFVNPYLPSKQG